MKKEIIVIIAVGAAIIIGVLVFQRINSQKQQESLSQAVASEEVIAENNTADKTIVNADYPKISTLENKDAEAKINAAIAAFVKGQIDEFKTQAKESQANPDLPQELKDQNSQFSITYATGQSDNKIVSIQFSIMNAQPGMAHPNNYNKTLTFNAQTGEQLQLSDLFKPDSDYVNQISTRARELLTARQADIAKQANDPGVEFFIDQGTAPDAKNFENFMLGSNSLIIFFDPGTVAADFAGTQNVAIPLSELSGILKPEYQ